MSFEVLGEVYCSTQLKVRYKLLTRHSSDIISAVDC